MWSFPKADTASQKYTAVSHSEQQPEVSSWSVAVGNRKISIVWLNTSQFVRWCREMYGYFQRCNSTKSITNLRFSGGSSFPKPLKIAAVLWNIHCVRSTQYVTLRYSEYFFLTADSTALASRFSCSKSSRPVPLYLPLFWVDTSATWWHTLLWPKHSMLPLGLPLTPLLAFHRIIPQQFLFPMRVRHSFLTLFLYLR